jgi:hypothetical protein
LPATVGVGIRPWRIGIVMGVGRRIDADPDTDTDPDQNETPLHDTPHVSARYASDRVCGWERV